MRVTVVSGFRFPLIVAHKSVDSCQCLHLNYHLQGHLHCCWWEIIKTQVIARQPNFCSLLNPILLTGLTLGHHTMDSQIRMSLITMA